MCSLCHPDGDRAQTIWRGQLIRPCRGAVFPPSIEMAAAASIVERRRGLDEAFHRTRKADAVERSQSIDAVTALDANSRDQVMLPAESRASGPRAHPINRASTLQPRPDLGHLRWVRSAEPGLTQIRPNDALNVAVVNGRKLAQEREPVRRRGRHEHADGVLESC
jgi:hypothetical protein